MSSLQDSFKQVMAHVATPVAVVTAQLDGRPAGATVSAFTSVSMTPPMILVALDRGSETLELVTASKTFGLNILGRDQHATALTFATKGGAAKFDDITWDNDHGAPRLAGTASWIACAVHDLIDGGDHIIALGDVVHAEHQVGEPLTYHGRRFGTHSIFENV